ncbi:MAG: gliding motility-associated protein GldE [Bacteroidota bacterium]
MMLLAINSSAGIWFASGAIGILLILTALIAGAEMAFFSLNPAQLKDIQGRKTKTHERIKRLLERPKHLLSAILISNSFINVAIVITSTYITTQANFAHDSAVLVFIIQVVVVTSVILLFGEIMPKIYASQKPVKFSMLMSGPLEFLVAVLRPLSALMVGSTNIIERRIRRKGHNISIDELSDAIDITSAEDPQGQEKEILKGIVKIGDTEVSEVMRSRVDVTAVDHETSFDKLLELVVESGFSRIPVFAETFDSVLGILYVKDLLGHLDKGSDFEWQKLIRPAMFIPENKKINDLLTEFQKKKIHLAIVVDEYGGTSGIVTMEDIIEEIVGDIKDEYDDDSELFPYTRIDENTFIFEAKTSLNDFFKITDWDDELFDDVKHDSESLAGLILEITGRIPARNETLHYKNITFVIESVDSRRIKQVKVTFEPNLDNQDEE